MKTATSDASAVTLIQRMWLKICCWCLKGQKKMTLGKTLKPLASLWRTDRCSCDSHREATPSHSRIFDKSCPQWRLLIMLSKHGVISEYAHAVHSSSKAILDVLALGKWLGTGHWWDIFRHTVNEQFWVPARGLSHLARLEHKERKQTENKTLLMI